MNADSFEQNLEQRKEKIENKVSKFMKDPYNLALVGVLLFAFIVRFYYFFITKSQPLWWDEAVYGTLAKNYITHMWNGMDVIVGESVIRPFLFPFLWSILLRLGANEVVARFFLEFIPSILSVFFVYLIGKELYDKKVGLISAFIFSALWLHLFYTARLLTDSFQLVLLFPSFYFFIKFLKSEPNFKLFAISLLLLSFSTLTRYQNGIFFFVYFFLLIPDKKLLLNKAKFWIYGIVGLIPMWIFFISNQIKYGNIFPALLGGSYLATSEKLANPIGWDVLKYLKMFNPYPSDWLFLIFFFSFILGMLFVLFELSIGYNFMTKERKLKNHLFLLLSLFIFYSFFVFYIRSAEDRWLLPTSLPLVILAAIGIMCLFNFVKKYNNYFAIFLVFAILILGAYSQVTFADSIIENKQTSYLQIRQGFEWIKANTPENSVITGIGIQPYAPYYSERKFLNFPDNESEVGILADADYIVIHGFTPQTPYISEYLSKNQDKWVPVNVFFFDAEQKQPALVIYQKQFR